MVIYSVMVRRHFITFGAEGRTSPILRTLFQVPYPVSLAFATLAKTPGCGVFFPFWKTFRGHDDENLLFTQVLSFHTLAHSLARRKSQLVSFQAIARSLPQNTRGGGGDRQSLPKLSRSQHGKFGNRESQCGPQKHIRWEVRLRRNPGKADCARRAVRHPWYPSMLAITMRENRRNGKRCCRVTGRKTRACAAEVFMTAEECIGEIAIRRDVRRTQPPRRHLHHDVHDGAVGVCLAGKQRGMFRVRIVPEMSHHQKRRGNNGHSQRCIAAGKYVVESFKSLRSPEVRRIVRISDDQRRRHARYRNRRRPMPSLAELHREQPDIFLILQKVFRHPPPGNLAVHFCCLLLLRRFVRRDGLWCILRNSRRTRERNPQPRQAAASQPPAPQFAESPRLHSAVCSSPHGCFKKSIESVQAPSPDCADYGANCGIFRLKTQPDFIKFSSVSPESPPGIS